jgi:hypothetical protein
MALEQKRIRPLEAWSLTRGLFWPLLGLFLVVAAASGLLRTLPGLIALAFHPQPLASFADWEAFSRDHNIAASPVGLFGPLALLRLAYSAVLSVLSGAVLAGIAVTAYRSGHPSPSGSARDLTSAVPGAASLPPLVV